MTLTWSLKRRKVASLKEWSGNPRKLTEKGLDDLAKSIQKFSLAEPIVINTDGTICGGHGRKKVLKRLKISECDCYVPNRKLTEEEFAELNIRLNRNQAGIFDFDILANEFEAQDLIEWGFAPEELGIVLEEKPKPEPKAKHCPECGAELK